MSSRLEFIKQSAITTLIVSVGSFKDIFASTTKDFNYQSDFIKFSLNPQYPAFSFFSTDSLGQGNFKINPILPNANNELINNYKTYSKNNLVSYFFKNQKKADWEVICDKKKITLRSRWQAGSNVLPFDIMIGQKINHATVLGVIEKDNQIKFPCILHLPSMGTFRVSCNQPDIFLNYNANRAKTLKDPFVKVGFSGADEQNPDIKYTLESVVIYPNYASIKNDSRFDGFRKNYINIFQLNPNINMLANNSASDACTFTLFLYAEMALVTPALTKDLTAMDLVKNSLDQYLLGALGYGQVGYGKPRVAWQSIYNSSDSLPSLIISASYYALQNENGLKWAEKNYLGIKKWIDEMIVSDRNGDGIIEYGYSGNAGSWQKMKKFQRPANWWDAIGFGHDDAYSNALAYHACVLFSQVADKLNKPGDAKHYTDFALKLKGNYFNAFYNSQSGLLAGWRSEDGKLHDYWFTFINSIAVCYGLLTEDQSKTVMKNLLAKFEEVGYSDFGLGLPGNLKPIRSEDYAHHSARWGWGKNEDGADGFQIYENGGATACYTYFTIKALYKLGMKNEAENILLPMLKSYKNAEFEGNCEGSTMTKDWKTWNGECHGYEGFLVDNYLTFKVLEDYNKNNI